LSIPVIAAGDFFDHAVFEPQMIHEASGAVVVSPSFNGNQPLDAIRFAVVALKVTVFIIIRKSIIPRVMLEAIDAFLFPDLHMIRCAALGQDPVLEIPFRNQTNAAPKAVGLRLIGC
jgi:hypothetical protein